jgi:hypothetical protein
LRVDDAAAGAGGEDGDRAVQILHEQDDFDQTSNRGHADG